jgi:hypothetical protein
VAASGSRLGIAAWSKGGLLAVARSILVGIAAILLVTGSLGLALRIYLGRPAEDTLTQSELVGLGELRPPLPGNGFLACPPGFCAVPEARTSPVFDMPWERLHDYWNEMIDGEPRVVLATAEPERRRFVYIQHSALLRFPDIVSIEFVAVAPGRSSVAVYSRSRYGSYDFGVNRARVERWLNVLQRLAQPTTGYRRG